MKKITFIAILSFLTLTSVGQNKLGHINAQEILILMPEFKQAETELQNFTKSLESQLMAMSTEYQQSLEEYQSNEAKYTDLVKQDKEAEIMGLRDRIQKFEQNATKSIQEKEQQLLIPINTKLNNAVNKVASDGGYTYILTSQILLYSTKSNDIGQLVKKELKL
jgi:outer membrane protein